MKTNLTRIGSKLSREGPPDFTNGKISSKVYDKQDGFKYKIVNLLMEIFLAPLPMVYMFSFNYSCHESIL